MAGCPSSQQVFAQMPDGYPTRQVRDTLIIHIIPQFCTCFTMKSYPSFAGWRCWECPESLCDVKEPLLASQVKPGRETHAEILLTSKNAKIISPWFNVFIHLYLPIYLSIYLKYNWGRSCGLGFLMYKKNLSSTAFWEPHFAHNGGAPPSQNQIWTPLDGPSLNICW